MKMDQATRHFGTQEKIGKSLGISQAAVGRWTVNGIPIMRQIQLEYLSNGKLKADKRELAKLGVSMIVYRNDYPGEKRKAA